LRPPGRRRPPVAAGLQRQLHVQHPRQPAAGAALRAAVDRLQLRRPAAARGPRRTGLARGLPRSRAARRRAHAGADPGPLAPAPCPPAPGLRRRRALALPAHPRTLNMRGLLFFLLLAASAASQAAGLRFALVKTAETETRDAFTIEGGAWTEKAIANHVAVLIEHHAATLLLDTSLGRQVDSQFESEMPWYDKPLLRYGTV